MLGPSAASAAASCVDRLIILQGGGMCEPNFARSALGGHTRCEGSKQTKVYVKSM